MVSWHGPFFDVRLLARCYANISSCNVEMFFNSGYKYYIPRLELLIGPRLTPPPNMWPVRRLQTLLLASMKAGRWLRFSGLGPRLWKRPDGRQKDLKWTPVFFLCTTPLFVFVVLCCRLMRVHNRPERTLETLSPQIWFCPLTGSSFSCTVVPMWMFIHPSGVFF